MDNSATKIFFEGGNNSERIGGSSSIIFHINEKGQTTKVMYDLGALFAPENIEADAFVADVTKYLGLGDEKDLQNCIRDNAERQRLREYHKSVGGKPNTSLDALFITHMHEDHIGGLIHLLRTGYKFPKIYSSKETCAFIKRICAEGNISNVPEMEAVEPNKSVKINDDFIVTPYAVSHSTVGALGFHTLTRYNGENYAGIMNMGDFHLGKVPLGRGFEEESFKEFMKGRYVTHVLADSTSSTVTKDSVVAEPVTYDEAVANYSKVMSDYPQKRIASAVISRSLQNLTPILEAAKKNGKKVYLDGYMIKHTFDVAFRCGLMNDYADTVYRAADCVNADMKGYLTQFPTAQQVLIFSGAFAEGEGTADMVKAAGMVKVANGMHKAFSIDKDTVVVVGQRAIPVGNTPAKARSMYEKIHKLGATVIQNEVSESSSLGDYPMKRFQRSGHASESEMTKLIEMTKEERGNKDMKLIFLPVHGDVKQLSGNAKVGIRAGAEPSICYNGDVIGVGPDFTQKEKESKIGDRKWLSFTEVPLDANGRDYAFDMEIYTESVKNGHTWYQKSMSIARISPEAIRDHVEYENIKVMKKVAEYEELSNREKIKPVSADKKDKRNMNLLRKQREMRKNRNR